MSVFLSPDVYIKEIDESQIVAFVSAVVGSITAPFLKGDSSAPFYVTSKKDFLDKCGIPNPSHKSASAYYASMDFLKKANKLWINRIEDGATFPVTVVDNSTGAESSFKEGGIADPSTYMWSDDVVAVVGEEGAVQDAGGTLTTFNFTVDDLLEGIVPGSATIHYTIGTTVIDVTADAGVFTEGNLTSGTIDNGTGEVALVFSTPPDASSSIDIDYTSTKDSEDLFIVYSSSKGAWANERIAFKVSLPGDFASDLGQDEDDFIFQEFLKNDDGSYSLNGEWVVSMKRKLDLSGNTMFIEDVINKQSTNLRVRAREEEIDGDKLPKETGATPIDLQTGSDGLDVSDSAIALGWERLENPDTYDMKVLINGGFVNQSIQQKMIEIAEARQDCVAILDAPDEDVPTLSDNVTPQFFRSFNSSYACVAYPWQTELDLYNDRDVSVCPSGKEAMVIAQSSNVSPYLPPAGLNRGIVNTGTLHHTPTKPERQILADIKVNLIRNFPGIGKAIFSHYTLQKKPSATSFLNTRMLLIDIEMALASALLFVNFEFINQRTYDSVTIMVENFMDTFLDNGVEMYEFKCNSDLQTELTLAKRELNANLVFKPMGTADVIKLNVVYTSSSARFDELVNKVY